ncbi:MAG: SRPBCC family protein [Nocardioides sp.]
MPDDSTAQTFAPLLEKSIEIDASPAQVWSLVTDVKRMTSWSPQVVRSSIRGGDLGLGTKFTNINRQGPVFWPTTAKVVRFEPHQDFAFRINENNTIWSFALEPTPAGGTRVTQRRETPNGISPVSMRMTRLALGGQTRFTARLKDGMTQTLARIKAEAEA